MTILFQDDFERAIGQSELRDASAMWMYTWLSHTSYWAPYPTNAGGSVRISNDYVLTGTRSLEMLQKSGSTNGQCKIWCGDDQSAAGWSMWSEAATTDGFYARFPIYFPAGFEFNYASSNRHHLFYLFAGAFQSPTVTDLTIYLDYFASGPEIDLLIFSYNQKTGLMLNGSSYNGGYYGIPNAVTPPNLVAGNWYDIQIYVKMNTFNAGVANSDGMIKMWVNDRLCNYTYNCILRNDTHQNIGWMQMGFGPNTPESGYPAQDQSYYVDNIIVSDQYIGNDWRVFLCDWVSNANGEASYIWHNYSIPSVQMRINQMHCLVAMKNTDVIPALENDVNVTGIPLDSTNTISSGEANTIETGLGISATSITGLQYQNFFTKAIKRATPSFDLNVLKSIINNGQSMHIDLINSEMDI